MRESCSAAPCPVSPLPSLGMRSVAEPPILGPFASRCNKWRHDPGWVARIWDSTRAPLEVNGVLTKDLTCGWRHERTRRSQPRYGKDASLRLAGCLDPKGVGRNHKTICSAMLLPGAASRYEHSSLQESCWVSSGGASRESDGRGRYKRRAPEAALTFPDFLPLAYPQVLNEVCDATCRESAAAMFVDPSSGLVVVIDDDTAGKRKMPHRMPPGPSREK